MKGILFNLPEGVITSALVKTSDLADRGEVVGGDVVHSVPVRATPT
jgi:hypothetical protein